MRKIIAGFASSLDGYIESPNGEYDWIIIDKEIDFAAHMKRFDTYLMGRKTYEKVVQMGSPPSSGISNYVYSTTLTKVASGYELVSDNIKDQISFLKNEPGKDIAVFGGAGLLTSLLDMHLVNEISISIIPVLLGKGKPMVDVLKEKVWLSLIDTKTYGNGTVQVNYKTL